jgi:hypothetical protein
MKKRNSNPMNHSRMNQKKNCPKKKHGSEKKVCKNPCAPDFQNPNSRPRK